MLPPPALLQAYGPGPGAPVLAAVDLSGAGAASLGGGDLSAVSGEMSASGSSKSSVGGGLRVNSAGKKTGSRYGDLPGRPSPHDMPRPYFEDIGSRNVSAVVGQTAVLRCRVKHLGEQKVSWIRKRDLHILTNTIFTYTGDGRFAVVHPEGSDDWDLKIEFVQLRDGGIYECQVNTEPKINHAIMLSVEDTDSPSRTSTGASKNKAAQANISGPEEVFVKKGSTISLTCTVNVHSTPPGSVLWYHGPSVVDFDSPRGGISLETERTEKGTTSKLLVTRAELSDSGNYTCVPSNANPASVGVHVLNGEHPAAMQRPSNGAARSSWRPRSWCSLALAVLAVVVNSR